MLHVDDMSADVGQRFNNQDNQLSSFLKDTEGVKSSTDLITISQTNNDANDTAENNSQSTFDVVKTGTVKVNETDKAEEIARNKAELMANFRAQSSAVKQIRNMDRNLKISDYKVMDDSESESEEDEDNPVKDLKYREQILQWVVDADFTKEVSLTEIARHKFKLDDDEV
jgi:hypothetical protein